MLDLGVFVKCATFGGRNADKVLSSTQGIDDRGRTAATIGQFTGAAKTAAKLDNNLGKGAQAAISTMCKVSEHNKVLEYATKGANWASKNVNPLLVGAAGYRVITADDKEAALKKEVFGMTAMFAVEGVIKKFLASNYMVDVHKNMKNKYAKAALAVIEGLGFVGGSIAGSTAGYKIGEVYVKNTEKPKPEKEININELKENIAKLEKELGIKTGIDESISVSEGFETDISKTNPLFISI